MIHLLCLIKPKLKAQLVRLVFLCSCNAPHASKEAEKAGPEKPKPPIACRDSDSVYTHLVCVSACLAVCHIPECTLRWIGKMRRTHEERRVERQDRRFVNGTHYQTEI